MIHLKLALLPIAFTCFSLDGCKSANPAEPRSTGPQAQTVTKVMADLMAIQIALDEFAANNGGTYPDSIEKLVAPDTNGHSYLNQPRLPRDPWNREYVYTREPLRLLSLGRDGAPGGAGEDADIECTSLGKRS